MWLGSSRHSETRGNCCQEHLQGTQVRAESGSRGVTRDEQGSEWVKVLSSEVPLWLVELWLVELWLELGQ